MPTLRRSVVLTVAMAALATLLSGCFLLPHPASTHTASTHTDESVAADLARFYTQSLTWTTARSGIDTTKLTVPLDWDDPTGATIELAIARHRAPGHPLGSLLINPGGPGGSGYDFVENYSQYVATSKVLAKYDVIGFDPRGVNKSTPVVCYTDPKQEDELLYGTYRQPYGSQGWYDELVKREKDWAAACEKNTGPLLGHLDAASVARDMDVIRAVLGDTKMHYLGYSYGTYLGTMYAELFPKKVGRMVLDGAVDPLVGDLDALSTQMAGFDSALKAYMASCLKDAKCPFDGPVGNALQQVQTLLAGIDARHLTASDGRALDSATVGTGISETLYSQSSWTDLTQMFADLKAGKADSTFQQADYYNNRDTDGRYSNNGDEVYVAVTCDEGTLGTDGVDVFGDLDKINRAAPILGKYFAYDDTAVLEAACSNWPEVPAVLPTSFSAKGAPPIIVIGTTNDPATPYAQSVSLAKQLSSGVLFTHHGEGHTVYAQGNSCIDSHVDAYLIDGTVPSADPDCS